MVALVAMVACSGGETADTGNDSVGSTTTGAPVTSKPTTTTTAPPSATTSSGSAAAGEETELCRALLADLEDSRDLDVFDPAALEEATRQSLAALEQLEGEVPAEVRDDLSVLLAANLDYVALLEENDWNILSISEDDPRVVRMASAEVIEASAAITDFCGLDLGEAGSSDPTVGGGAGDLMPPQAGEVLATDPIFMVESMASYEELVAHYTSRLGRKPVNESEEAGLRNATFIGQFQGEQVVLWVQETEGGIIVEISRN